MPNCHTNSFFTEKKISRDFGVSNTQWQTTSQLNPNSPPLQGLTSKRTPANSSSQLKSSGYSLSRISSNTSHHLLYQSITISHSSQIFRANEPQSSGHVSKSKQTPTLELVLHYQNFLKLSWSHKLTLKSRLSKHYDARASILEASPTRQGPRNALMKLLHVNAIMAPPVTSAK